MRGGGGGGGAKKPAAAAQTGGTIQDGVRLQTAEERRAGNEGDVTAIERQELLRAEEEERRTRREAEAAQAADEEAAMEMDRAEVEEAGAVAANGEGDDAMEVVVDPPE